MRLSPLSVALFLAVASSPAFAQSDEVCPSGQVNTNPAGSPVKCEADVTAVTPAPDVVQEAGDAVKSAGETVKDAGEAVADTVSDAVKDIVD